MLLKPKVGNRTFEISQKLLDILENSLISFVDSLFMHYCLFPADFNLDDKTFRVLWHEFSSHGGIDYDDFVAVLTKLQILKGNSNIIK